MKMFLWHKIMFIFSVSSQMLSYFRWNIEYCHFHSIVSLQASKNNSEASNLRRKNVSLVEPFITHAHTKAVTCDRLQVDNRASKFWLLTVWSEICSCGGVNWPNLTSFSLALLINIFFITLFPFANLCYLAAF